MITIIVDELKLKNIYAHYNPEESLIYSFGFYPLTGIKSRKGRLDSNDHNRRLKIAHTSSSVRIWEHQVVPYYFGTPSCSIFFLF